MSPENNSNLDGNSTPGSANAAPGSEVKPAIQPSPLSKDSSPQAVAPGKTDKPKGKKTGLKNILMVLVVLLLIAGAATAAFYIGKSKRIVTPAPVATAKPINLPPEAIVTAECTPGRGKQYIIPKDIPVGPIYDVKNSKVIAIEYLIGIKALLTNSDNFSSTILLLTKNYPVDHFAIVPVQPKAGDTDQYIHLIMFVVSKAEASSITCGASTGTTPTSTTAQ